jgi:hypothetical protein
MFLQNSSKYYMAVPKRIKLQSKYTKNKFFQERKKKKIPYFLNIQIFELCNKFLSNC